MTGINLKRFFVLLLCLGIPYLWAASIRSASHGAIRAVDFGEVYYGARCAVKYEDPYNPQVVLREFEADGGRFPADTPKQEWATRINVTKIIYLPTALLIVSPFTKLRWPVARAIWLGLITGLLILAALLIWRMADKAPILAGSMVCFVLLNCVLLLVTENALGIVAPFCVIAAWCFLNERYAAVGVIMLAVSLLLKPHDAGFVWLYFLLAGGAGRRRALQTLAIAAVVGIGAAIWIAPISPHWTGELRANLTELSARGGLADPGPTGASIRSLSPVLCLQTAVSILDDDPRFYNPVSYVIGGGLILVWALAVLRRRASRQDALLALAAVSILMLLPVYHWPMDAKLLLLTIPACAMLWRRKGPTRWVALGFTAAAIFVTSDIPTIFEAPVIEHLPLALSKPSGRLALLALQPAPLVLLAAGCFYLWVYIRYEAPAVPFRREASAKAVAAEAG